MSHIPTPSRPDAADFAGVREELTDIERKLEGVVLSVRWARRYLEQIEIAATTESSATGGAIPAESGRTGPAVLDPASGEG